ncbi:calcium-binding protein [Nocardioides stalactiti]|uniref:calcium-binding protein n=1 Tax=Nocardioides stalactiti TaxID=2755356 RepID=UPI0015FFF181|nr:calcium-binding protein [Nocardioides stalactiti]
MVRRAHALVIGVLAAAAVTSSFVAGGSPARAEGEPPGGPGTAGPPYEYETALMGESALTPLPDQAMITRTEHGYLVRAGQQDSHLVVTLTDEGLRFEDSGTQRWKKLARRCRSRDVAVGVAAVCRVPGWVSEDQPLLLEFWPRLGDDYFDASTLGADYAMTMLSDAGHDTAHFGDGPDFFNGFTGRDRVWGGGGDDWIRTGDHADLVWGGGDDDQVIGSDGRDELYGEDGDDRLGGGAGDDRLDGGAGEDFILCDIGLDGVLTDGIDRLLGCESVDGG